MASRVLENGNRWRVTLGNNIYRDTSNDTQFFGAIIAKGNRFAGTEALE